MECETLESGQEVRRINVEVKRVDEVVIPVVAGDQTYPDSGLAQVAGPGAWDEAGDGATSLRSTTVDRSAKRRNSWSA